MAMANPRNSQKPKPLVLEFEVANSVRIQSSVLIGTPILRDPATGKNRVAAHNTQFLAIWDTGAPYTLVVPKVVKAAKLAQRGFRLVGGIGSAPRQRPAYPASIVFYAPTQVSFQFVDITMLERDDELAGADILIGMDIIKRGETRIGPKNGGLWFSFIIGGGES